MRTCAGPGIPGAASRTAAIGIVVSVGLATENVVLGRVASRDAVRGDGIDTGVLRCSGGGATSSSPRRTCCGGGGSSASATHTTGATGTGRPSRRNNWSTGSAEPEDREPRDARDGGSVLSLLASSATVSDVRGAVLDARGGAVTSCTSAFPIRWMGTGLFYRTRWSVRRPCNMNSK